MLQDITIPITHKSPFLNIYSIHADIQKYKGLGNKRQRCKCMPRISEK